MLCLTSEKTVFAGELSDRRMIFYTDKVPLSGAEMAFFEKISKDQAFPVLPQWWRSGDTLRFAHTVKLDVEKTKIVC